MMFKEQSKRINSTALKLNSRPPTSYMIPLTTTTTTTVITDNSNVRFIERPSNVIIERWCFLLIHLLFYIIMLTMICVRLIQVNRKQENLLADLKLNHSIILNNEIQSRLLNQNHNNIDCSCQKYSYPKRNQTTHCLELHVGSTETIRNVFCPISDLNHKHNQWLIIQNRQSNNVNFNQTWNEYRRGFGNIQNQTDFWIGNENLYWLTNTYACRLKIELTDWHNITRIATYESFRISHQKDDYRLQIDGYNGSMETFKTIDSFSRWHHNVPFSTYDHYATNNINCPNAHGGGGWWYHFGVKCAHVQLNGHLPKRSDGFVQFNTGILWIGWKTDRYYSFQRVYMAIQQKLKRTKLRPG